MNISFKRLYLAFFNRKHKTKIISTCANLNAVYGIGTLISEGTTVSHDVVIGKYSYVNKNSYIEYCAIGNYCSISSGVYINPYEHFLHYRTTHPFAESGAESKRARVVIGNDVLISLNAIILSGVTIGDGAVIGAGAVVTKDVKPFEIVGGVPAKHIKWRFSAEEQRKIAEVGWWNFDIDTVNKNVGYFRNETDCFLK